MQAQSITSVVLPAVRQTVDADTPLPAIVDALADVQTAIATLEALEANLKAALVRSGLTEVCGSQVRAKISTIADGYTVEWSKLAKSFNPTQDQIDACSKFKAGYTAVKLYGYN